MYAIIQIMYPDIDDCKLITRSAEQARGLLEDNVAKKGFQKTPYWHFDFVTYNAVRSRITEALLNNVLN